jgi:tripartite-type tricarboxylate transporter receptor subunit TctC
MASIKMISAALPHAAGEAAAEPTAGKNLTVIISGGIRGGNDQWGRLIALHLGKHLPGRPTVVPQNMPGATVNAAFGGIAETNS